MSKNKSMFNLFKVFGVAMTAVILSGCLKTGTNNSTSSTNISFITLMNMAPYSSSTEVYFNGDKKTPIISPGSYSTNYGQVPPGNYDIKFKVASADSVLSEIPPSSYDSLGFYTLILYNPTASPAVNSMKIVDDFTTLSLTGANYRFFNLCPDYPVVDLYMNTTEVQPGRSIGDNYNSSYFNSFVPITSGGYSVQAKKAGTDSVIASISSVGLQAGNAYTIFLMGSNHNSNNPVSLAILQAAY
ncbi:MAG TPA: DUF4397 domain-containing protein [Puia sp.]|nr:DUF4397 domain-containing protein [Puia sp.]